MQCDMLNILKGKEEKKLGTLLKEYGKIRVLSEIAQFLDKRAYITIDISGNLKRKKANLTLPIFAFFNDDTLLKQEILNSCDIKERQKFDKIERFSSLDIEKVKLNFIKTLFNGNLEFSKKYGKELFLRANSDFFKIVSNFSLIGDSTNIKPLMVLALKKLMKDNYDENIFHLFISYMTKYRDNTAIYENVQEYTGDTESLRKSLKENTQLLNSFEGLGILSALKLIDEIRVDNKSQALGKIKFEIENIKKYTPLNEVEKDLLKIFL